MLFSKVIGQQDETNKLRIAEFTVLDHLWFDDVTGIRFDDVTRIWFDNVTRIRFDDVTRIRFDDVTRIRFDDVTRIHPGKRLRQVRQFRHVER
jgi:hypothetical protein